MLIFDFTEVASNTTTAAAWIDGNRRRVGALALQSWNHNHHQLPSGLDSEQPFRFGLSNPVIANESIRFNLDWSVQLATGHGTVLAGDLAVQPLLGDRSHLEIQGSCRELVGWMTEVQNEHARRVMLHCVRSFLAALAFDIEQEVQSE